MENIFALVVATCILVAIPGPNAALIVANSLRHGLKGGLITTVGTTVGVALQLVFVALGTTFVINLAATGLDWIRWLGVVYLIYLGIRTWREPADDLNQVRSQSAQKLFFRGFGFAVVNPKTLLFNAAFLPQFVRSDANPGAEIFLLVVVFLVVLLIGDALWAVFANFARRWMSRYGAMRNKITGGFLLGAAAGLALSRRNL